MSRGIVRERQVRRLLEIEGYWTSRAAGSFGDADVIALRANKSGGCDALLVEVKSDVAGPFAHFRPADRAELIAAAVRSGARPVLCWWPPHKQPRWIPVSEWPATVEDAAVVVAEWDALGAALAAVSEPVWEYRAKVEAEECDGQPDFWSSASYDTPERPSQIVADDREEGRKAWVERRRHAFGEWEVLPDTDPDWKAAWELTFDAYKGRSDDWQTACTWLASIASADPQSEQARWMVEQAREGLRRAGGHDFGPLS